MLRCESTRKRQTHAWELSSAELRTNQFSQPRSGKPLKFQKVRSSMSSCIVNKPSRCCHLRLDLYSLLTFAVKSEQRGSSGFKMTRSQIDMRVSTASSRQRKFCGSITSLIVIEYWELIQNVPPGIICGEALFLSLTAPLVRNHWQQCER